MATGGEHFSLGKRPEEVSDIVCDPCQEVRELHKAVGICIDCQDHLCQKCFDAHKIARPFRKHELLDKEAMLQSQVSIIKDKCTEKCDVHEDKVIEYYCINHSHLGCSDCNTLDHSTCDSVRCIPHVAKDLANNKEYQQVESQLISVVGRSKKVTKDNIQKTKSLENTCSEAVKKVQEFKKGIYQVLDKAEDDLLRQCEKIRKDKTEKFMQIVDTLKTTQRELDIFMETKEVYKKSKQNCNMYTLMMKVKDKLNFAEDGIKEAEKQQDYINDQIKFITNKETINTMKIPETLGKLFISGTPSACTARPKQTECNVRQEEHLATGITPGTSSTVRSGQTESNVEKDEQTTSITSVTSRTANPEQTESNTRQEEQTTSITSGTSSTASPEQTESNVGQDEQTTRTTSITSSTASLEKTESNIRQEEQITSITSGTSSTARPEQTDTNVKQGEQTISMISGSIARSKQPKPPVKPKPPIRRNEQNTSITSETPSIARPGQTNTIVRQEEQTTNITTGASSTARPEQTENTVRQREQTTSITPETSSTARPEQTNTNVRQEEQATSITSGTSSTARPEQTNTNVRQEEQATSITSGTSSTARPEQTESTVRQKEHNTSITSGTSSTARPEQTNTNVRQEEQATSITSGTSSTARPEQTENNVIQEEQATSITSGTSSTDRPEQTESNVRQGEQTTSIKSRTLSTARPENPTPPVKPKLPVRRKEQITNIASGTARPELIESNVRQKEQTTSLKEAETRIVVRGDHIQDINVNHKNDKNDCGINGLVVLQVNRLVTTGNYPNKNVKLVDVKQHKVITCLTLSSAPFDVALVTNSQVAITMPRDEKVAMVIVAATLMTVDRTLDVDGNCYGVDYREGKLAVSFLNPDKVQVLTLQGGVLHTIKTDQQGHDLFIWPSYVSIAQDNTSLYVSNCVSDNVVNVKFDGTFVGTYTDSELRSPMALLTDRSDHVYVCGQGTHSILQITPDCREVQKLLIEDVGLRWPQSISYSETNCRLYVGMYRSNVVKVYKVTHAPK